MLNDIKNNMKLLYCKEIDVCMHSFQAILSVASRFEILLEGS